MTGALGQFWGSVGGYLTYTILFMGLAGIAAARKNKNKILLYALGGWVVLALLRVYGFPGVAAALNLLPGISKIAIYRYIPPTFELASVLLAMVGLDAILKKEKHPSVGKRELLIITGVVCAVFLLFLPYAFHEEHRIALSHHHLLWFAASAAWAIGTVGALVVTIFFFRKYARILLPLIMAVDVLVMFVVPQLSAPRSASIDMAPVNYLKANLGVQRFYSLGSIMPNYGSYFGIASINTNDLPVAQNWANYVLKNLNPNVSPTDGFTGIDRVNPNGITPVQAFLANMPNYGKVGVKYVIVSKALLLPAQAAADNLTLVFNDAYYDIYQLPSTTPYFSVSDGSCTLTPLSRAEVTADCAQPSTLVRSELYMKGWQATDGSKKLTITQSGPLFQQVKLPAGKSDVVFSFAPPHIELATAAMIFGLLAIAGFVVYEKRTYFIKLK